MGDRVWASIRMSGTITPDQADELIEALEAEYLIVGATPEWEDVDFTDAFEANQVNYGNFETLEATCGELGISYLKSWGAGCEFESGMELYDAAANTSETIADVEGEPVVKLSNLIEHIRNDTLGQEIERLQRFTEFEKHYPPLKVQDLVTAMEAS
jgi:hypothetical protein